MGIAEVPDNSWAVPDTRHYLFLPLVLVFATEVATPAGSGKNVQKNLPPAGGGAGGPNPAAAGAQQAGVLARGAWLDGVPLMHDATIRWSLKEGTEPVVETFDIDPRFLGHFVARAADKKPITLSIVSNDTVATFRELWVIGFPPSANRHLARVEIADRRWFWKSRIVLRRMNMRRKAGVRRVKDPAADNLANNEVSLEKIQYARYSLEHPEGPVRPSKWSARSALFSVLRDALGAEEEVRGQLPRGGITIAPALGRGHGQHQQQAPLENVELDDRADDAVARMLEYIPSAGIFVDADGKIVVYQKATKADQTIRKRLLPHKEGKGQSEITDMFARRPRSVRVFFTYEVEVRFDYKSEGASGGTTVVVMTEKQREIARRMQNVLDVPDATVTINAMVNDKREDVDYAQGNWVPIDENLFTAWGNPSGNQNNPPLTDQRIRQLFVPYISLWDALVTMGLQDPDADWGARVAKLVQHWRKTFRLPQRWMDRTLSIEAYRVATLDRATGARAPASAFTDFWVIPGRRAFHVGLGAGANQRANYGGPVKGYPTEGQWQTADGNDVKASPFSVRVEDGDQGIVSVDYLPHPSHLESEVLMGTISGQKIPNGRIGSQFQNGPPGWDLVWHPSNLPELDPNWGLATILTLTPAAPNDTSQLFMVEIHPHEVRDLVPQHVADNLGGNAVGPSWEVRIPRSEETARVAWIEKEAGKVNALFGVGAPAERVGALQDPKPDKNRDLARQRSRDTEKLIVNLESGNAAGAAGLREMAKAAAAEIYTRWANRPMGQIEGHLKPGLVVGDDPTVVGGEKHEGVGPAGALGEVVFELHPNGEGSSSAAFPEHLPQIQMWAFLDDGTRKTLMRIADKKAT